MVSRRTLSRQMSSPRSSRRSFLATGGAFGAAAMLGGCGISAFNSERALSNTGTLTIINWAEYIDEASIERAQAELALTISYRPEYTDNVSGFAEFIEPPLSAGASTSYDLIVPTNWVAARMINNGWVEALPTEVIPNHVNIDPVFLTNEWDRGSRFQMPWQAGITGIAYDPEAIGGDITSVQALFDPALRGRVGLVGEMREAVGLAMLANGDDPARPTPASARAGLSRLTSLVESGQFAFIVFDDFVDRLLEGSLDATMAWSGQAAALALEDPRFRYVIPSEGAISWFDTMVIPRGAPNFAEAARWMNWAYDPVNAAEISLFNLYVCPVLGTQDALRAMGGDAADLADNPLVFPDAETRNRLFTWGTLDLEVELAIESGFDALFDFFDPDTLQFTG